MGKDIQIKWGSW